MIVSVGSTILANVKRDDMLARPKTTETTDTGVFYARLESISKPRAVSAGVTDTGWRPDGKVGEAMPVPVWLDEPEMLFELGNAEVIDIPGLVRLNVSDLLAILHACAVHPTLMADAKPILGHPTVAMVPIDLDFPLSRANRNRVASPSQRTDLATVIAGEHRESLTTNRYEASLKAALKERLLITD